MTSTREDDGLRQAGLWRSFIEGRFYFLMAVVVLLVVGFGYSRAFDLTWIHVRAPFAPILRIYTLLAVLWAALLVLQTGLAQAGQTHLHKTVGPWGLVFSIVFTLVAIFAAVTDAQVSLAHAERTAVPRLLQPLENDVLFGVLVLSAAYWRRNTLVHRRLMLLAAFTLAGSAFSRFPTAIVPPGDFGVDVDLLLVLCLGRDQIVRGRIHPVYAAGLGLFIALQILTPMAAKSRQWDTIGSKITQMSVPLSWGASDWASPPT